VYSLALLLLAALVLLAMRLEPLAERFRIPFSVLLVVAGFALSEAVTALGLDTGLRYTHFVDLVLHGLVPILVFRSAFGLSLPALLRDLPSVLLLAIPLMLMAATVTGLALFAGIAHPGFPIAAAMLTGIIVSATDPVAVIALLERVGAPERLRVLLEGESLFNDAAAVVAFGLLVAALDPAQTTRGVASAFGTFVWHFAGGALLGVAAGAAGAWLYQRSARLEWVGLIGAALGPGVYLLAEHSVRVSGIVAVLCAGLLLGTAHRRHDQAPAFVEELWQVLGYAANAIVFLLVGATITLGMFTSHWLAMLIGIAAATAARAAICFGLLPAGMRLLRQQALMPGDAMVLHWGGLRGAVALALALSLPTSIDSWYTIQSTVYGVVLFTLFVQAPLMDPLVRRVLRQRAH